MNVLSNQTTAVVAVPILMVRLSVPAVKGTCSMLTVAPASVEEDSPKPVAVLQLQDGPTSIHSRTCSVSGS